MSPVKIISGILSAAVIFLALGVDYYTGWSWAFAAFTILVLLGAQAEFYSIARNRSMQPLAALGLLLGGAYLAFALAAPLSVQALPAKADATFSWLRGEYQNYWEGLGRLILAIAAIAPLVHFLIGPGREHAFESSMATTFGLVYVAFLGSYVLRIRFQSLEHALLFVCTAKGGDIGAYFTGTLLGRHPLHKESPKKTIEGSIGGIMLGTVLALAVTSLFLRGRFPLSFALFYGVLVCAAAQVGDLGESLIKRRCNVKDSSHLIPGSGGLLDFVDCLLFSAPAAYYFVEYGLR